MKRTPRIRVLVLALAGLALMVPGTGSAALGPNLLPNSSFERSVVHPPPPVDPYQVTQPLVPEGWAFEGAAGLFDHSQNDAHAGRRMAAISIPASGKRTYCVGNADPEIPETCADDPTTATKEGMLARYYSVPPAWRNAVPVAVKGSTSYTVSAWLKVSFVTEGESAVVRVRWLDANGLPIQINTPLRLTSTGQVESNWTFDSATLTSPSNARQAVVLLAHTTDVWLGQVRFDQVFLGETSV